MDFLEHPSVRDVIVCKTVMEEVGYCKRHHAKHAIAAVQAMLTVLQGGFQGAGIVVSMRAHDCTAAGILSTMHTCPMFLAAGGA